MTGQQQQQDTFGQDLVRGLAWGIGVTIGVLLVLFMLASLIFVLLVTSGNDADCPPGLEGTGACDGLPGALRAEH